ncbi:melanocyte-stimulating hormone receptor [Striga asiatica]|uniref:Melanocyte-stimulating hormone receptor n=1 Tax=Striga asiatica TaxID=4170 RepID=A0A5A7PF54_STRAF|nr:melanocyte-stimulating hormone receptor [Striga asiatica]
MPQDKRHRRLWPKECQTRSVREVQKWRKFHSGPATSLLTMDIESEEALVLLLVEDIINLRNLCLLLAYVYIKLVVQPRQHRRVRQHALNNFAWIEVALGVYATCWRPAEHQRYSNNKFFHNVLQVVLRLHTILVVGSSPVTDSCTDWRWRWFKGCLGALDGTYVPVRVPVLLHPQYRNRKDCRILRDFVHREGGLRVLTGNYYLCDAGNTNGPEFLASYRGVRYHLHEFGEVMESTGSGGRNSQANGQRRVWYLDEESALIQGLCDLVSRAWKCDNRFRSGYTNILEQHMAQYFPGTNIKVKPHISSKITVWKKHYGQILGMLGSSGFEWSETGNMIVVKDDAVWQAYIKANPKAKTMCYKSWPFYGDWVEIFGKDRATGEGAQGFTDAVNGVLHKTNVHAPSPILTEDFPEHCDDPEITWTLFRPKRVRVVHPCAQTDDVYMAPVLKLFWFGLSHQLSELMQKDFSWMKLWNLSVAAQWDIESNPGQTLQNPICLDDTNSDVLLEDIMEDDFEVQQQVQSPIQEDPLPMGPNDMDDDHESDVDSCVDSN